MTLTDASALPETKRVAGSLNCSNVGGKSCDFNISRWGYHDMGPMKQSSIRRFGHVSDEFVGRNKTLPTANVRVSKMPTELSDAPYAANLPFSLYGWILLIKSQPFIREKDHLSVNTVTALLPRFRTFRTTHCSVSLAFSLLLSSILTRNDFLSGPFLRDERPGAGVLFITL